MRREDTLMKDLTAQLPWPTQAELKDPDSACRVTYIASCDKQSAKRKQLRETRQKRLAFLNAAAAPTVTSWPDLLVAISTEVLAARH
jgi:hypothetical protein